MIARRLWMMDQRQAQERYAAARCFWRLYFAAVCAVVAGAILYACGAAIQP